MQDRRVQQLAERYAAEARAYRELWAPVLQHPASLLLQHLRGDSVARVLDVGAGVGMLFPDHRTAFPGAAIAGVDRSFGMISQASRDTPLAVMDGANLGIASNSVDAVVFAFVLFHLPEPSDGLREARRVLRANGRVGTLTWASEFESKAARVWNEELDAHGAKPPDVSAELAQHDLVDTAQKVQELLASAGFNAIRTWTEVYERVIDREHLLRLRTSLGRQRVRFETLDEVSRVTCLDSVHRRLEGLATEDYIARGSLVYGVGTVA